MWASVAVAPGSGAQASVAVARASCSEAGGIFPDQGSNPCLLHWQADSLPLSHQGSPRSVFLLCVLSQVTLSDPVFSSVKRER